MGIVCALLLKPKHARHVVKTRIPLQNADLVKLNQRIVVYITTKQNVNQSIVLCLMESKGAEKLAARSKISVTSLFISVSFF